MKQGEHWCRRWRQMIDKIKRVETPAEKQDLLQFLSNTEGPLVMAFVNAHAMNSLAKSTHFFEVLMSADILLRDGSGMATVYKLLNISPGINLNGTDLIPELLRKFDGRCIALFGTQHPYLEQGVQRIAKKIAPGSEYITAHGFLDVDAYVELAMAGQPAVIVLGMGMPKQEMVASALRAEIKFPCLIICGGAIIDFLGRKFSRAPVWMQIAGIEWVFRLVIEPRRLFNRYVIGNPLFLVRALFLAILNWREKKQATDPL